MLIHDRGELICKFIIAGVRFMLHGMPPRLTQGYWHIPSIPHFCASRIVGEAFRGSRRSPARFSPWKAEVSRSGMFRLVQLRSPDMVSTLVSVPSSLETPEIALIGPIMRSDKACHSAQNGHSVWSNCGGICEASNYRKYLFTWFKGIRFPSSQGVFGHLSAC